jgi:hypothetical protein
VLVPASALEAAIAAATESAPAAAGAAGWPRGVGVRGGLREVVLCRLDARVPAPLPEGAAATRLARDAGSGDYARCASVSRRHSSTGPAAAAPATPPACLGFGMDSSNARVVFGQAER